LIKGDIKFMHFLVTQYKFLASCYLADWPPLFRSLDLAEETGQRTLCLHKY
ncbi:hypothetical protein L9F63_016568, partial [Diploptera punctata]